MIIDPDLPIVEVIRIVSGLIAPVLMVAGLLAGGTVDLLKRDRDLALLTLAALVVAGVICRQLQPLVAYLFPLA
jgi:hypothetical protein